MCYTLEKHGKCSGNLMGGQFGGVDWNHIVEKLHSEAEDVIQWVMIC